MALDRAAHFRTPDRQLHRIDACAPQSSSERVRKQWVAIVDQMAAVHEEGVFTIDQIQLYLLHPIPVRRRRDSRDLYARALQVDHKEHELPNVASPCHDFDRFPQKTLYVLEKLL